MSLIRKAVKACDQQVFIVLAIVALIGCALVIYGCVDEARWQSDLLRSGTPGALDAYTALVASDQLSLSGFMVNSVTGRCFAYGATYTGLGVWIVFVISPLVAAFYAVLRDLVGPWSEYLEG